MIRPSEQRDAGSDTDLGIPGPRSPEYGVRRRDYIPRRSSSRIVLFTQRLPERSAACGGLGLHFASAVDEYRIAGSHRAIVTRHVAVLASLMRPYLRPSGDRAQMQGHAGQRGTTNPGRRVRAGEVTPRVTMVIDCGVAAKFQSNVSSGAAGVADRKRASRPRHTIVAWLPGIGIQRGKSSLIQGRRGAGCVCLAGRGVCDDERASTSTRRRRRISRRDTHVRLEGRRGIDAGPAERR